MTKRLAIMGSKVKIKTTKGELKGTTEGQTEKYLTLAVRKRRFVFFGKRIGRIIHIRIREIIWIEELFGA